LDLHAEATARERHGFDKRGTKGFIACLNIREIHIREQIGQKGQKLICEIMVKIEDTGCLFDTKTATIGHISQVLDKRQYEVTNFFWGILEIGILNDGNLPRDFLQTTSYCCCLPRIPLLSDETYLGKTQCLYFLAGGVRRTIIDDNH